MKSFLELKMKKRLLKSKKPAQIYSYILVTQPSRDDQSDQWPKFWSHLLAGRPKNNSRKKYRNCSKRSFVPVFRSWHWESWNYVVEPKYLYMKKKTFSAVSTSFESHLQYQPLWAIDNIFVYNFCYSFCVASMNFLEKRTTSILICYW